MKVQKRVILTVLVAFVNAYGLRSQTEQKDVSRLLVDGKYEEQCGNNKIINWHTHCEMSKDTTVAIGFYPYQIKYPKPNVIHLNFYSEMDVEADFVIDGVEQPYMAMTCATDLGQDGNSTIHENFMTNEFDYPVGKDSVLLEVKFTSNGYDLTDYGCLQTWVKPDLPMIYFTWHYLNEVNTERTWSVEHTDAYLHPYKFFMRKTRRGNTTK